MPAFKPEKLRVNLRLCINRLKLLEKKKTEQALKARKEIADYIKAGRLERARIRVEHIIREDYMVEAMEILELYCDLLLARFGMLQTMKFCEESLMEPISTLIWVTPRLSAELQELNVVLKQLEGKFGKEFVMQAQSNLSNTVNPKVIHRMGVEAPNKALVENYMIEIARNYKVEFEPDPSAFIEDDNQGGSNDMKPYFPGGNNGGGGMMDENNYVSDPVNPFVPPPMQAGPIPQKVPPQNMHQMPPPPQNMHQMPPPAVSAPPYSEQPPPVSNTSPPLPYPTAPSMPGVQPPPLPNTTGDGLDLPPVPTSGFPDTAMSTEGDVDFDDLTKRFEDLKKRR